MGKALFAFFWLAILETLILSFAITPLVLTVHSSNDGLLLVSLLVSIAGIVTGVAFIMVLYYGYQILVARMVRDNYVTLGYLFYGFKKHRPLVFRTALVYAVGLLLIFIMCHVLMLVLHEKFSDVCSALSSVQLLWAEIGLFTFVAVICYVRFMFVWLCLYDSGGSCTVFESYKRSWMLLKGHILHAVGFVLYSGGRYLLMAAVLFVSSFLVAGILIQHTSLLFIFRLAYITSWYSATVRMFMSIPVYYDALMTTLTGSSEQLELEEVKTEE